MFQSLRTPALCSFLRMTSILLFRTISPPIHGPVKTLRLLKVSELRFPLLLDAPL